MMRRSCVALVLCSSLLAGQVGAFLSDVGSEGYPGEEKREQVASWDEVNVIAHGLLQLGHSLKEHVNKTKEQMREIAGQLGKLQRKDLALLSNLQKLEGRYERLSSLLHELLARMDEAASERTSLWQRLLKVEDMVMRASHLPPAEDWAKLQSLMEAQNKRVEELQDQVKLQQYSLDKQNLQIESLHSKIQSQIWREPWKPDVSENQSISTDPTQALLADCTQLFVAGQRSSGVYLVKPARSPPLEVFCDMAADGGWTVIQRRMDGSVNFDQMWEAYRTGFGYLKGEFWLGLEKMFHLTQQRPGLLRIELQDWKGQSRFIELRFTLGGQDTSYALNVHERISGDLDNAIRENVPLLFSTRDRDQDRKPHIHCAQRLSGGWWFSSCGHSNLNGRYFYSMPRVRHDRRQGIFWKTGKGRHYPLKATIIKMRTMEPGTDPNPGA